MAAINFSPQAARSCLPRLLRFEMLTEIIAAQEVASRLPLFKRCASRVQN